MKALLQLITNRCLGCTRLQAVGRHDIWCDICAQTVEPGHHSEPSHDGSINSVPIHCAWRYAGVVRETITSVKARGGRGGRCLAGRAFSELQPLIAGAADVLFVPVPPQHKRLRSRLGHLPDIIANEWASRWTPTKRLCALGRHDAHPVRRQCGARGPDLRAAWTGAGQRVVIVDDVVTTGMTLRCAIDALTAGNWQVVAGLCLADARPQALL